MATQRPADNRANPEKRGRFEVWPEQVISHGDWLALPKAPVGYLEQMRYTGAIDGLKGVVNKSGRVAEASRQSGGDTTTVWSEAAATSPATIAALVSSGMSVDAAQAVLRHYSTAVTALSTLRGSLLGMGKSMGVEHVGGGAGALPGGGHGHGSATSSVSDAHTVIHRDRDEAHEAGVTSHAPAAGSPALERYASSSQLLGGGGGGGGPLLQRTMSMMSSSTAASGLNEPAGVDLIGPPLGKGLPGMGSSSSSLALLGLGGGGGGSELERLRADIEATRQAKTKLLLENKLLQEKLEKTANELTVTQQKLRRVGVQA